MVLSRTDKLKKLQLIKIEDLTNTQIEILYSDYLMNTKHNEVLNENNKHKSIEFIYAIQNQNKEQSNNNNNQNIQRNNNNQNIKVINIVDFDDKYTSKRKFIFLKFLNKMLMIDYEKHQQKQINDLLEFKDISLELIIKGKGLFNTNINILFRFFDKKLGFYERERAKYPVLNFIKKVVDSFNLILIKRGNYETYSDGVRKYVTYYTISK
jgi:hypothetical protein